MTGVARLWLDRLYAGAGWLAGVCIVLITLMILAQIVGRWFGIIIPSTEDFSGYLLAAASFLALASTFRHGNHIRVTVVVHQLPARARHALLIVVLLLFCLLMAYCAWQLSYMVYESWRFDELSQGYIAVPLWLPQTPMALGAILFFIALVDDFIFTVRGQTPGFIQLEE